MSLMDDLFVFTLDNYRKPFQLIPKIQVRDMPFYLV